VLTDVNRRFCQFWRVASLSEPQDMFDRWRKTSEAQADSKRRAGAAPDLPLVTDRDHAVRKPRLPRDEVLWLDAVRIGFKEEEWSNFGALGDSMTPVERPNTSSFTGATPRASMLILAAAALERSITRPPQNGPRSLTRTTTLWLLDMLVTFTRVPQGRKRCAAVIEF